MNPGGETLLKPLFLMACLVLVLSVPVVSVTAADLTDIVIPSEDELRYALELGEISPEQYLLLCEIARRGLDSTNAYLLDDIPNLHYFGSIRSEPGDSLSTGDLKSEQAKGFVGRTGDRKKRPALGGRIGHRYYSVFGDTSLSWYRTRGAISAGGWLEVEAEVDRTKSGRERVTGRSVTLTPRSTPVARAVIGGYTARLGMGTAVGYRGKLLDYSDRLDAESMLFPDCGEYNGALTEITPGWGKFTGMVSESRDCAHGLTTAAIGWSGGGKRLEFGSVAVYNRLRCRETGGALERPMLAVSGRYVGDGGYLAAEVGYQGGDGPGASVVVVEGTHRRDGVSVSVAGWVYGDDLVELTTGSKAGSLTRTVAIADVGFRYSAKRPGQEGLLLRSRVRSEAGWRWSVSALYAGYDRYHRNIELSSGLLREIGRGWSVELAYVGRYRDRLRTSGIENERDYRLRLETGFRSDKLRLRSYIARTEHSADGNHWSAFVGGRYGISATHRGVEWWLNMTRFAAGYLNYAYGFVRGYQQLHHGVDGILKLSHRYNRSSADPHETIISLEVVVSL